MDFTECIIMARMTWMERIAKLATMKERARMVIFFKNDIIAKRGNRKNSKNGRYVKNGKIGRNGKNGQKWQKLQKSRNCKKNKTRKAKI